MEVGGGRGRASLKAMAGQSDTRADAPPHRAGGATGMTAECYPTAADRCPTGVVIVWWGSRRRFFSGGVSWGTPLVGLV